MIYDYVIIGSGVSGGRIAGDLTRAGAKCILLEAGRGFNQKTFPKNEMDGSTQLFWGGGLELNTDASMGLLRAKVLGGTSIVNQALLDRFDENALNDWKEHSGVSFFETEEIKPYYEQVESRLDLSQIPEAHYNRNTKIFTRAFEEKSFGWKPLRRAQKECRLDQGSDCLVCLNGCPRNSKQSSLVTSIEPAQKLGLKVETEFEVDSISYSRDQVKVLGLQRGRQMTILGAKCVLAAGSLGNTKILLRSDFGNRLPAVGTRFTCHPQFMTYALFDQPVDAHKGAFQAVKSEDAKLRAAGFKLENVFAPPIATALLMPGMGKRHHKLMQKYRFYGSMEVAIRDEASGTIKLNRAGQLVIDKQLTREDRRKCKAGLELVRNLFEASEAKEIIPCKQSFGLHLMGGCPIGVNPNTSVVNPEFQIHDHPGIFVADSSIFPSAPGINPSLTIMALSQKALEGMK